MGESTKTAENRLSRGEIVLVARQLLADEGAEGLTMRRLGEACGVRGAALYWHFKDKDELLGAIVDSVVGDLESGTDDQPWDERLVLVAQSLRRLLVGHPGLAIVAATGYALPDTVLAGLDQLIAALVSVGFTHRQAIAIHYGVLTFTTGFVVYETSSPLFDMAASAPGSAERSARSERFTPLLDLRFPALTAAARELDNVTVDELFGQSLGALVQGWAAQLDEEHA